MASRLFDPAAHGIDTIRQQALRRVECLADLPDCFSRRKDIGPENAAGWIFSWRQPDGTVIPQFRSDNPPLDDRRKPIRYMSPPGTGGMLSVPPGYEELIRDPTVPLVIVEGSGQHLAVASSLHGRGVAVIGMVGCHGWSTDHRPTPQLDGIALRDREVVLLPDADMATNFNVWTAITQLAGHLKGEYLTGPVRFISIPGHGTTGADDILGRHSDHRHRGDVVMAWIEQAKDDPGPVPPGRDPGFSELMHQCLDAIERRDIDTEMSIRARLAQRFRLQPDRIDRSLLKALEDRYVETDIDGRKLKQHKEAPPESLDLSKIGGLDFQVDGFCFEHQQAIVIAKWGTGKTTAMLAMAFAHIEGHGFLDREGAAKPGKVLFIAEDSGPRPVGAAMAELGLSDHPAAVPGPGQRFFLWSFEPGVGMERWGCNVRGIVRLQAFIKKHGITQVIIDSAKTTCAEGDISYADNTLIAQLLTTFDTLICPHASVVWITHDGTDKEANAGAKAWSEYPSAVHRIDKVKGRNDVRQWTCTKSRIPGQEREFLYSLREGQFHVVEGAVVADCSEAIRAVMAEALHQGQEKLTNQELAERCLVTFNLAEKTVRNNCTKLVGGSHPWLLRASRGRYTLSPKEQQRLQLEAKQGQGHAAAPAASGTDPQDPPIKGSGSRDLTPLEPSLYKDSSLVPRKSRAESAGLSLSPEQNPGTLPGTAPEPSKAKESAEVKSRDGLHFYRELPDSTSLPAGAVREVEPARTEPKPMPPGFSPSELLAKIRAKKQANQSTPQPNQQPTTHQENSHDPKPPRASTEAHPGHPAAIPLDLDAAAAALAAAFPGAEVLGDATWWNSPWEPPAAIPVGERHLLDPEATPEHLQELL